MAESNFLKVDIQGDSAEGLSLKVTEEPCLNVTEETALVSTEETAVVSEEKETLPQDDFVKVARDRSQGTFKAKYTLAMRQKMSKQSQYMQPGRVPVSILFLFLLYY